MNVITKADAIAQGLTKYFTGIPCFNGHLAKRLVSNDCCTQCLVLAMRKHRANPENRAKGNHQTREYMRKLRMDPVRRAELNAKKREIAKTEKGRKITRNYVLRTQMNTSIEQVEAALERQNHQCSVCKKDLRGLNWGKKVCDHDHVTGQFRSVLCCKCNAGLGWFNEDPQLMRAAIEYLSTFHKKLRNAA
jgi:hypothetical protein